MKQFDRLLSFAGACIAAMCGIAAAQWTVSSPDNSILVSVRISPSLQYSITKGGTTAVDWSSLGIKLSSVDLSTGVTFVSIKDSSINETYTVPHGRKTGYVNNCRESALLFEKSGTRFHIVFRAYNTGAAYRYRILGTGTATATGEASSFVFPTGSTFWTMPQSDSYEGLWRSKQSSVTGTIGLSALAKTATNIYVLMAEAAVYGTYCLSMLNASSGSTFTIRFPQSQVSSTLPWETPWRVAVIGPIATIVEGSQELIENLNPPCEITDRSWIKPGRVSWSWLTENVTDINQQKRFVDFSSLQGWEYCLVDEGWRNTSMDQLTTYAKSKNVGLLLWYTYNEMDTKAKRDANLTQCAAWGIKGLKVDFMMSDVQSMMQFYDDMTKAAIQYKMLINFHGAISPRGMVRRWPNLITQEGILGEEYYRWTNTPTPVHNCIVPYTRNAVGGMDYTPTVFSFNNRQTTDAHELALSVAYLSSLQHLADNPASYTNKTPNVLPFLKEVPASWDEEKFIEGTPGEYFCVARRKGTRWFIAGINTATARTLNINLSFLKTGTYSVSLYSDLQSGSKTMSLAPRTLTVPGNLQVTMQSNGGFCVYIDNSMTGVTKSLDRAMTSKEYSVVRSGNYYTVQSKARVAPRSVQFINAGGQMLLQSDLSRIEATRLRPGIYIARVFTGETSQTIKFIHE